MDSIGEGLFQICNTWSAHTDLDKLSFVDKYLEIVSSSFGEYLGAHSRLKTIAFSWFGSQTLRVKFDFSTSFGRIPAEES